MREIKFRGKTLDGRWIYGDLWHRPYAKDCVTIVSFMEDTGTTGGLEVIPETVGQYTGLKDKNGVKIFEGDVLNIYQYGHVVAEFAEGCYGAWDHYGFSPFRGTLFGCGGEVIGNIYENPELMA